MGATELRAGLPRLQHKGFCQADETRDIIKDLKTATERQQLRRYVIEFDGKQMMYSAFQRPSHQV